MSKSILHIKNSKSKSNKHKQRGKIGKDCLNYNPDLKICNINQAFCKSKNCTMYAKDTETNDLSNYNDSFISLPQKAGTHETSNQYISVSRNIGTMCHVGYMHKPDGENRRHKSRCIFLIKSSNICNKRHFKCIGSNRCEYYCEKQTYNK